MALPRSLRGLDPGNGRGTVDRPARWFANLERLNR